MSPESPGSAYRLFSLLLLPFWFLHAIWHGMADGNVVMAPYTNMPEDVAAMAKETEEKIRSGAFEPFTGPIMKQDGTVWLKDGEKADEGALLGLNFYVKGVDDKLAK